jgi:ribosomal protein L7/L12
MTEKTAKRIAKSLEILAGQTTVTGKDFQGGIEGIAKKLNATFSKLSTVKIIKCISGLGLKEAKDIADRNSVKK